MQCRCQTSDHGNSEAPLSVKYFRDPVLPSQNGNEIHLFQTHFSHSDFYRLHWIRRIDWIVQSFILINEQGQNIGLIAPGCSLRGIE